MLNTELEIHNLWHEFKTSKVDNWVLKDASRNTYNSDYIKDWKNKDAKLLTNLLKPEYKDINFKLNFFSLIFNSKIISKLKSLNSKEDCCYSYILTGKVIGANWEKDVPENIPEPTLDFNYNSEELYSNKSIIIPPQLMSIIV